MRDQAEQLRLRVQETSLQAKKAKVVSVLSGKGGVGKTNVAVNLSLALSGLGKKVVLVDLDIGMGNVHLLLGLTPRHTIADLFEHHLSVREIIEKGPGSLDYVGGDNGLLSLLELDRHSQVHFVRELEKISSAYDYIVFDIGAGLSEASLKFVLAGHEAILVATPEITSLTDAYSMIKLLHAERPELPVWTMINQCENEREGRAVHDRLNEVSSRFLGKKLANLGKVSFDPAVRRAVMEQSPFVLESPRCEASGQIQKAAHCLLGNAKVQKGAVDQSFISKLLSFLSKS
ncbi:MinD/ParA family protein [Fictibacillus enclensis]|uniref:MinD/ParA family protein n=1 Tax=Fictibacillus enclensis TaxID=1017270 RepID=UPI0025A0EC74|nr:MinD/ParA family protein [Fictibacillus enclensis]MDM5338089.1 MinD/ParA family protein [Fictibacillus enclensis]